MNLKELGYKFVICIELSQGRVQWRGWN